MAPAKRQRTEEPPPPHELQAAAFESEDGSGGAAAGAPASPFDLLPDAVLSLILERLGLRVAAAARAVCRRWRDAVEAVHWRRIELVVRGRAARAKALAGLLVGAEDPEVDPAAAAAAGGGGARRWIRVAAGGSLRLDAEYLEEAEEAELEELQLADERGPHMTALSLVRACAAASGGGLGGLELALSPCPLVQLDLLTQRARPACPALHSLALRTEFPSDFCADCLQPSTLPWLLRPFPRLTSLALPECCALDEDAVAALARSRPRLKRLEVTLEYYADGAALSGLSALEYLDARLQLWKLDESRGEGPDVWRDIYPLDPAPLVKALAAGPAARSLKELSFGTTVELSWASLSALRTLPALERLGGFLAVRLCTLTVPYCKHHSTPP
eukprot:tig00020996_g16933.t1